ncbi:hypothetical protein [Microvirga yunnanensis]|uniref:hypothetical protein n=1 Tax=Microvirga yunnanensis TaxID=2953740 RepID=UPI0021CAD37A|nr:hypothetical protein [Microvirga sp. HBU65207]
MDQIDEIARVARGLVLESTDITVLQMGVNRRETPAPFQNMCKLLNRHDKWQW